MSSVLRSVRKRKKGRTLGAVDVIDREGYAELEVDAKVELIRSLIPLGLMHIEELLDEEVTALAGERDARKDPSVGGRRHGSNPGTVGLAGQRVPIRVPRIRHVTEREIPLRSYEALHGDRAVNDLLLTRISDFAVVPYGQDQSPRLDFWGSDARNRTTEGDTRWVNDNMSHFSSRSTASCKSRFTDRASPPTPASFWCASWMNAWGWRHSSPST